MKLKDAGYFLLKELVERRAGGALSELGEDSVGGMIDMEIAPDRAVNVYLLKIIETMREALRPFSLLGLDENDLNADFLPDLMANRIIDFFDQEDFWRARYGILGLQMPNGPRLEDLRDNAPDKEYSADEKRVVKYLAEIIPDVGAGDDPIGFLIASHAALREKK